jgi:methionine synthase II (cobalamin-independent)
VIEAGIVDVVKKQHEAGIDCVGDGEFWKSRGIAYYANHFTGIETRPLKPGEPGSTRTFTRERDEFAQFYKDSDGAGTMFFVPGERPMPPDRQRMIATGPV